MEDNRQLLANESDLKGGLDETDRIVKVVDP
jgi:hypothetical protein